MTDGTPNIGTTPAQEQPIQDNGLTETTGYQQVTSQQVEADREEVLWEPLLAQPGYNEFLTNTGGNFKKLLGCGG